MAKDKYVNKAFAQVTESAANTLTFSQLSTGGQLFQKKAWIINRIEWFWTARAVLAATADYLQAALTSSNKMVGLGLDDPAVIDMMEWHCLLTGTGGNLDMYEQPSIRDFTNLPGGGLIIPGYPIFIAANGASLASAQTVSARIYFTLIDLKADEYIELVEALRMVE